MQVVEIFSIIFGILGSLLVSLMSYTLWQSKKNHKDNQKRIDKLEAKITTLEKKLKEKDNQLHEKDKILKSFLIYLKKILDLLTLHHKKTTIYVKGDKNVNKDSKLN